MKEILNRNKAGLILGTFSALMHVIWSVLVAVGIAQPLVDLISTLHFFGKSDIVIQSFNFGTALMLIIMTFIVGYLIGNIFAAVVNFYNKK